MQGCSAGGSYVEKHWMSFIYFIVDNTSAAPVDTIPIGLLGNLVFSAKFQ